MLEEDWAVSIQLELREGLSGAAQDEVRKERGVHIGRVATHFLSYNRVPSKIFREEIHGIRISVL